MTELERSHDELRAAIRIAVKQIRKLTLGRREDPVLVLLERVLLEARQVRQQARREGRKSKLLP